METSSDEVIYSHTIKPPFVHRNCKRKAADDKDDNMAEQAPVRKRPAISRRPCSVCADDVLENQFPGLPHKQDENNTHDSDVCYKCYSQHLSVEVKNKHQDAVKCPQCMKPLDQSEIRELASDCTYQEYLDKAARRCMQQDEDYHACPNADCTWGAYFTKGDGNIFVCAMCKARYCLCCEVPFHEEQTCEEYQVHARQRRSEEEQSSLDTIKKVSRPCPGPGCGVNIDKYDGCDHVTCQLCEHEFCWECFAPYDGERGIDEIGNDAHSKACPHASHRQPDLDEDDVPETSEDEESESSEGDESESSEDEESESSEGEESGPYRI